MTLMNLDLTNLTKHDGGITSDASSYPDAPTNLEQGIFVIIRPRPSSIDPESNVSAL